MLTLSANRVPPIAYTSSWTQTVPTYALYKIKSMPLAMIKLIDTKQITAALVKKWISIIGVQSSTIKSCNSNRSICLRIRADNCLYNFWFSAALSLLFSCIKAVKLHSLRSLSLQKKFTPYKFAVELNYRYRTSCSQTAKTYDSK